MGKCRNLDSGLTDAKGLQYSGLGWNAQIHKSILDLTKGYDKSNLLKWIVLRLCLPLQRNSVTSVLLFGH